MKLVDLTLTEFAQVLGSDKPAPGGGSAAALSAVNGISLTKMVCKLTIGKKKYEKHQDLMKELHQEASRLQKSLLDAVDKDTEAFNLVSAVFALPKETDDDKLKRRDAMQKALKEATKSPFAMMQEIFEALEITKKAVGNSNRNAASDLGVAALALKAALQGAWLNVLINIAGIKDEVFVREYRHNGQELLERGCQLADAIYSDVLKSL